MPLQGRPKFKDIDPGAFDETIGYTSVELKFDGHYCEFIGDASGWALLSRTGKVKECGAEPVPSCHLCGEHVFGTQWSIRNAGKLACGYGGVALFNVFAWNGRQVIESEQASILKMVMAELDACALPLSFCCSQRYPVTVAKELWATKVLVEGWEGLVFKGSKGWARMKRRPTMDYVLLSVEESTADKYAAGGYAKALTGGLYIDGKLKEVARVSGMTEQERQEFWKNRDKLVGQVFEAVGRNVFASGALRHPAFVKFRPDKLATECTWVVED